MPPQTPEQPKSPETQTAQPAVEVLAQPESREQIVATPEIAPIAVESKEKTAEEIMVAPVAQESPKEITPEQPNPGPKPMPTAMSGAVITNREKIMYDHLSVVAAMDPYEAVNKLAAWRQQELVRLGVKEEVPSVEAGVVALPIKTEPPVVPTEKAA